MTPHLLPHEQANRWREFWTRVEAERPVAVARTPALALVFRDGVMVGAFTPADTPADIEAALSRED